MRLVGAYAIACLGLALLGALGGIRPASLTVYALGLAIVAGLATGFTVFRARQLRTVMGRIKAAAPVLPSGIVEAPPDRMATLLGQLRGLGFTNVGATITTIEGSPPMQSWILVGDPGTTWVEVGLPESPMAIFLSQAAEGRFLETTTAGGETIDHPALHARTMRSDPADALAAHRRTLAEWEARSGPARSVSSLADYLEAEAAQRELTGGLRIATYLARVVEPGIRHWTIATVVALVTLAALWGLDLASR